MSTHAQVLGLRRVRSHLAMNGTLDVAFSLTQQDRHTEMVPLVPDLSWGVAPGYHILPRWGGIAGRGRLPLKCHSPLHSNFWSVELAIHAFSA